MSTSIEQLNIEIASTSEGAISNIDKLASYLGKLKGGLIDDALRHLRVGKQGTEAWGGLIETLHVEVGDSYLIVGIVYVEGAATLHHS